MKIGSDDSKCLMQNTVCLEYGITDIKELSKWTNHSILVGMTWLLQSQGKAGDYIQRVLRWCSAAKHGNFTPVISGVNRSTCQTQ
jgi:hypothetical protein